MPSICMKVMHPILSSLLLSATITLDGTSWVWERPIQLARLVIDFFVKEN